MLWATCTNGAVLKRSLLVAALLLTAIVGPGAALAHDEDRPGTIVPLYSSPSSSEWNELVSAKRLHPRVPIVAIINPPVWINAGEQEAYRAGIRRLLREGIDPIGYVTTSYGNASFDSVKAELDRIKAGYPGLKGMFLDEMANAPGKERYYWQVAGYARSKKLDYLVGNPGTATRESYLDMVDVVTLYDNEGQPDDCQRTDWQSRYRASNFAVVSYNAADLDTGKVRQCADRASWIYVTDDVQPNPWDTLPHYFDDLLGALEEPRSAL
ncbi:hypothetical protein D5S17_02340 [Pseudonocardiaceae bacterium YIM PH 21723]|nr:hypothetical protein D5S17_02340 [Pseudonocardiaceae bacterium YIM PH 21723]